MSTENSNVNVVITKSPKSMGVAIALAFFFGPLGMFYSTILGAVIMILINAVVGILTMGIGLIITWPIQIVWTILAVKSYNKKLMRGEI